MSDCDQLSDLLLFYAAGGLDGRQRRAVEEHLTACRRCQGELRFWTAIGETVVEEEKSLPAPSPRLLESALAGIAQSKPGLFRRTWQLLHAQAPLLRREIWLSSALVMAIGYIMALVAGTRGHGEEVITAIAPLIAAAGVAMIYGPENDPALELALATPTSPWQVLLARLVLVFGYDLMLALLATLGLVAIVPVGLLGSIILDWLGPMTFLSALTLILSLRIGTGTAVTISLLAWLVRWLAPGLTQSTSVGAELGQSATFLAQAYAGLWTNSGLLLGMAALLVAIALVFVGRNEMILRRA